MRLRSEVRCSLKSILVPGRISLGSLSTERLKYSRTVMRFRLKNVPSSLLITLFPTSFGKILTKPYLSSAFESTSCIVKVSISSIDTLVFALPRKQSLITLSMKLAISYFLVSGGMFLRRIIIQAPLQMIKFKTDHLIYL